MSSLVCALITKGDQTSWSGGLSWKVHHALSDEDWDWDQAMNGGETTIVAGDALRLWVSQRESLLCVSQRDLFYLQHWWKDGSAVSLSEVDKQLQTIRSGEPHYGALFRCEWWWGGFTNKQNMRHVKTHQVHTRSIKGLVPKYSCTKIREKKSSYPFHTQYLP